METVMNINNSPHLQVAVDIGSREHYVAIGVSEGGILDEFLIPHHLQGFSIFSAVSCGKRTYITGQ
jgi:hypothetical protein